MNMRIGYIIFLVLVASCRKDHYIDESSLMDTYCTEFTSHSSVSIDTLLLDYDQNATSHVYFNENTIASLSLSATVFISPQNPTQYEKTVHLRASYLDSIGLFSSRDPEALFPFSLEPGDTLDPFTTPLAAGYYAFTPPAGNPLRTYYYVGLIKIIMGRKHVGYVKIGRDPFSYPNKFWIDQARFAMCAEEPIILD